MELILISSNKLKVILTPDEMKKYRLDTGKDGHGVTDKRHLASLLEDIKRKSGFSVDSGSVYIELFESIDGGCEIFISREIRKISPPHDKASSHIESILIYRFHSVDDLISVSRRIEYTGIDCTSRIYCDEHDTIYLALTLMKGYNEENDRKLIFMEEYGERMNTEILKEHLDEHGRLICSNAIEALSKI